NVLGAFEPAGSIVIDSTLWVNDVPATKLPLEPNDAGPLPPVEPPGPVVGPEPDEPDPLGSRYWPYHGVPPVLLTLISLSLLLSARIDAAYSRSPSLKIHS